MPYNSPVILWFELEQIAIVFLYVLYQSLAFRDNPLKSPTENIGWKVSNWAIQNGGHSWTKIYVIAKLHWATLVIILGDSASFKAKSIDIPLFIAIFNCSFPYFPPNISSGTFLWVFSSISRLVLYQKLYYCNLFHFRVIIS